VGGSGISSVLVVKFLENWSVAFTIFGTLQLRIETLELSGRGDLAGRGRVSGRMIGVLLGCDRAPQTPYCCRLCDEVGETHDQDAVGDVAHGREIGQSAEAGNLCRA